MRLVPLHESLPIGIELHRLDLISELKDKCACNGDDMLAPSECLRAQRFVLHADRVRFVQTRIAVRRLLADRLACHPADVPIGTGLHGKPCVVGDAEGLPIFNVSHAGAYALIALADPGHVTHVGVDIEAHKNDLDTDAVLALAFTERECREVRGAHDVTRAFYQRWVGKEAVLKAIGVGVTEHLQCVGIHPDVNGGIDIACAIPEWRGFEAVALPMPPGYAAALAWQTKEPI
ncbi:4'-phosphopantetheinyl transferase [Rhodoferax sp. OV413]|uniref:4'-phosphopantetheinyl transferase family protein n=1 Tax=Rhodoferax sp. OV413 TaxID=1855285 RepID=UPI0008872CEC|nr:4'-phosphopantetheinyl transferase superfamily protein [Rhodoferax sp. OV413]SDO97574.1 4'-phosphopantetheinyl transferase [Rhodoferax sp. OV413]